MHTVAMLQWSIRFLCSLSSGINGLVPVHAVTIPYDAATREFEEHIVYSSSNKTWKFIVVK